MTGPVLLLVNPSAGAGRALRALPAVEARLRALGVAFATRLTRDLGHARELAARAARAGETVVALSGDGVLGAVAGALRDVPGAVLGVLPGGKGNDFARMARLPLDPEAACEVVARGTARPVDLGDAGGRTFVGIASLGFDSDANRFADAVPARLGRGVYVVGALRALARWRPAAFEVDVDGERVAFRGWSVAAANSRFYGGGCSSPRTRAWTTAASTSCSRARRPASRSCARSPSSSAARTSTSRSCASCAARRSA